MTTADHRSQNLRGSAALLGAAFFWGFGFYAQRVSIDHASPLSATAWRFVFALPVALVSLAVCLKRRVAMPWRAGALLGFLLYCAFALQTVALKYTSTSRVALLTGLYAVFVPFMQPLFGMPKPTRSQWGAALLAMAGVVLLCGVLSPGEAQSPPNVGDAMTLGMAILSAVMVILVGKTAATASPLALNTIQTLTMSVISVPVALLSALAFPEAAVDWQPRMVWSLLYLAIFSTSIAFFLQMVGQKYVQPTTASILMLVETPIGVLAALALLGEVMSGLQWCGAAVLIAAVVWAVAAETNAEEQS
jgi:drug/metabolite transporter (DMT)-like permease